MIWVREMERERTVQTIYVDYDFHIFIDAWQDEAIFISISILRGVVFLFCAWAHSCCHCTGFNPIFFSIVQKKNGQKAKQNKMQYSSSQHQAKDERAADEVWIECFFFSFHSSVFLILYSCQIRRHRTDIYLQTQSQYIIINRLDANVSSDLAVLHSDV